MEDMDEVRLTLRLPTALRDRIAAEGTKSGRSLNAEIVQRLESSFDDQQSLWDEVNRLSDTVEKLQFALEKVVPKTEDMWSFWQGGAFGEGK